MSSNKTQADQVKTESEIPEAVKGQGKTNGTKVQGSKRKSAGIQAIREQLEKSNSARRALELDAQRRRSNTPKFTQDQRLETIDLEYSVQVDGKRFASVQPLVRGDLAKLLAPVISPLIRVANAALQANDLQKLKMAHERNPEGKLTDKPLKLEGQQLYVANPVDDLRAMWEVIQSSEPAMKAARALSAELEKLSFDKMPNVTTAKAHSSTYEACLSFAKKVGEFKDLSSLIGPVEDPDNGSFDR